MKRQTKEVLFNLGKSVVVGCYAAAAVAWSRVENPFKKGGVLDDESEENEKEKSIIDEEIKEFNKRWEEANEKIKNKE